jgi:cellulose synthase/poly-beta-1,6-N-acetylglucosamine synthase-like glycosyltransferase
MSVIQFVFWLLVCIIFYSYIGYGVVLWLFLKAKNWLHPVPPVNFDPDFLPSVSLVVACYNEADIIENKIANSFDLDYPAEKLTYVFITDGSSDTTPGILSKYPRILLLHQPERKGKVDAINRAMNFVQTPIVIFCDANTFLNTACIRELVKHFADERIGAVAGEKKVVENAGRASLSGAGEGLYWKYESFLKKLDSEFYTVVGAAGELFSMRTSLYKPIGVNVLLDDFIISMNICQQGYRVVYEPQAVASEAPSFNMHEEKKRKIRIGAGGFQSVQMLASLLNIFRYGRISFQYISHRVFRWVLCPFLLPCLILLNCILCFYDHSWVYVILLGMQAFFYLAGMLGWVFALKNKKIKLLYVPYYFLFMNYCLLAGFLRYINNRQSELWEKAKRY